jgi:hypothetical protein
MHVYDGNGLRGKFSEKIMPLPVLSAGSSMRIVFTSDQSVNANGFVASLTMFGAGTWAPTRLPTREPTRMPTRASLTTAAPTPSPTQVPSGQPSIPRPPAPTPTPTTAALRPCSGTQALTVDRDSVVNITDGPANYLVNLICVWVIRSPQDEHPGHIQLVQHRAGSRLRVNF